MSEQTQHDTSLRFLFEDADIRGELVHLGESLQEITRSHAYSKSTKALLGQFAAAAVLISNNLKYRGKIVLQGRSEGPISLIMVECTSESEIRGIARGDIAAEHEQPLSLIAGGQLAITIEREGGTRYQGIVALDGSSLSAALDNYFLQSEQLNTRFWLATSADCAAGMVLQQLPAQLQQAAQEREDQWETARVLAETLTPQELLDLPSAALLHRLYHEHPLRLFEPTPVEFKCSCSRDRTLGALSSLPVADLEEIIAEQGAIDMTCEMCGTPYKFERKDLPALAEPPLLH